MNFSEQIGTTVNDETLQAPAPPIDVIAKVFQHGARSYSDVSLICCAVSSIIRTNRGGITPTRDPRVHRLLPGLKPFFFHSLAYDPTESCRMDEVIAQHWESLNAFGVRVTENQRDPTNVQNLRI